MTISANDRRYEYAGGTPALVFAGPRAFSALHVQAYEVDNATQVATLRTDYTITGVGVRNRQTRLTFLSVVPAGKTLLILRTVPYEQGSDITNQGPYLPQVVEDALDSLGQQTQQLAEGITRSLRLRDTSVGVVDGTLPAPAPLRPLVWSASGTAIENGDTTLTGDMLLRPNLAAGTDNLFTQSGSGSVARAIRAKLRETVSVDDFGAAGTGVVNDAPAFALALAAGHKRIKFTPGKTYRLDGTMTVAAGVELVAHGANIVLGTGLSAGQICFHVRTSGFSIKGGNLIAAVRTSAIYIEPNATVIEDFDIDGVNFSGFFYDVFASGNSGAGRPVRNLTVRGCTGIAPSGINAGHFLAVYCDGVTYADNNVEGGYNTSVYGVQNCVNVTITGNRERGVVDTGANVEAAIQVEGGLGPVVGDHNVVISGNVCAHDIWVSDAHGVTVDGNRCRVLRLTVGNPGSSGALRNSYSDNICSVIAVQPFGTPGANKVSATFKGNIISSAGVSFLGVPVAISIFIDGSICNLIKLVSNEIATNSSTNAVALSRAAGMRLYAWDNEFGGLAHSIVGAAGYVYERNNRNPLYPADNGYVSATRSSNLGLAGGAWTALPMNSEAVDVNGEYDTSTGRFTPVEAGTYCFHGGIFFDAAAAGDDLGIRLLNVGSGTELRRLGYLRAGAAGFNHLALATTTLRLAAGQSVELQYFRSAATGQILAGSSLLNTFQVARVA